MADRCASSFGANSVTLQRGCSMKNDLFDSSFCSAEAIHRYSCLIRYCMETCESRTHTTTVTLRCIRRGLMTFTVGQRAGLLHGLAYVEG